MAVSDLTTYCSRGPCWKGAGHEGPCEPGSRLDPRRTIESDAPRAGKPCPYHSTIANGMRLFGSTHPCFTVYDTPSEEQR